MLPDSGNILKQEFAVMDLPSKTFRLDVGKNRIMGTVDQLEAVKQTVFGILNTERYVYVIHSWRYGVELQDLFGQPIGLVKSKLKKRIREALMQDNRIQSADAFLFTQDGRKLYAKFTVHTTQGEFEVEKEVDI